VAALVAVALISVGWQVASMQHVYASDGVERVSLTASGGEINAEASGGVSSTDGRYVAFLSSATNIVAGDTNGLLDVFVRDVVTGSVERVSVSTSGAEPNGESYLPSISADGNLVAFSSTASNLVPDDTNNEADVFLHNRTAAETIRVSLDGNGDEVVGAYFDTEFALSGDGSTVMLYSSAPLLPEDTDGVDDIYLYDVASGSLEMVPVDNFHPNVHFDYIRELDISSDASCVVFHGNMSNEPHPNLQYTHTYLWDRATDDVEVVSLTWDGKISNGAGYPSVSDDCNRIEFETSGNLVPDGASYPYFHTFVRDRLAETTVRVSNSLAGSQPSEDASGGDIDPTGEFVTYASYDSDLIAGDTNAKRDVFVTYVNSLETKRVSLGPNGVEADGHSSWQPTFSGDGSLVVFDSAATNLTSESDTNGVQDIFQVDVPYFERTPPVWLIDDLRGSRQNSDFASDPVSVVTGNFTAPFSDLGFGSRSELRFGRTYNAQDSRVTGFGSGWSHSFGETVFELPNGDVILWTDEGRRTVLEADGLGGWVRSEEIRGSLAKRGDGSFGVDWFDGGSSEFDVDGRLEERRYWDGEVLTVARDLAGELASVTSNRGPSLLITVVGGKVTAVDTNDGRSVSFAYDGEFLSSVIDEFGVETTFEPDAEGRLFRQVNSAGVAVVTNVYDSFDRVEVQTTGTGEVITFDYDFGTRQTTVHDSVSDTSLVYHFDEQGRTLSITDPFGNMVQRSGYDANGNPTSLSSRLSVDYSATFNDQDQPETVVDPASGTTAYTYDSLHRVETMTVPNGTVSGATTTYTYEGTERLPSTVTDDLGHVTVYDVVDGLVLSVTDADGVATTYTYTVDRLVETVTQVVDGVDLVTSYAYDGQGRVRFVTSPEGNVTETHYDSNGRVDYEVAADGGRTDYTYDTAGRVETITGPELSPTDTRRPVTTLVYDPVTGLLMEERRPGPGATGLPEAVTTFAYNDAGDVETITHPDGTTSTSAYGPLGRRLSDDDRLARTTTYGYNADGDTETVTNQAGEYTETTHDSLGRLDLQYDAERRVTDTDYDSVGRVDTVTAPGDAVTTYSYDELNRPTTVIDPRSGQTTTTYTPGGRVDAVTGPDGVVTDHDYDTAGRVTTVTRSGNRATSYTYDKDGRTVTVTSPEGDVVTSSYDPVGRVLTATDPAGVTTTRTWSQTGQLLTEQLEGQGTTAYVYDLAGNLESVADPLGNLTQYSYDLMGRRLTRTNALGKTETWTYHDDGQVETYTDPLTDSDGARTTTYTYDPDTGRLSHIADPSGRTTTMGYNAAGQVTTQTASMPDGLGGDITDPVTRVFDPATGRLTSVTDPTGTSTYTYNTAGDLTETVAPDGRRTAYSYDTAGRRSSITHPDGTLLDYAYDPVTGRLATITPRWSLADTFTAADGRAASTAKWATNGSGSAFVDSNRLAVEPDTTALSLEPQVPATLDNDLAFTYETPTGTADVSTLRVTLRSDTSGASRYRVDIASDGATVDLYHDQPSGNTLVATTPRPAGDQPERLRVRTDGDNVQVKVWDPAAEAEPATWSIDETITGVVSSAVPQITAVHGAGVPVTYLDDVTYVDLDAPPTAAATYTWDLDDRLIAETLQDGHRSWGYTGGRLTSYIQDHPDPETPGQAVFSHAGNTEQTWTVPDRVTAITVDMTGGEGGAGAVTAGNGLGGRGGRIQATLSVTPGETLHIGVGRSGVNNNGGTGGAGGLFGGGKGGNGFIGGGGGGGQTYLKQGGTSDTDRVLVAGGGGGGQNNKDTRAQTGGHALDDQTITPKNATNGANGNALLLQNGGGGGGAGWRGGNGGGISGGTAQGGTNMADTTVTTDVTTTAGYQNGYGQVTIAWVEPAPNDLDTTIAYDSSGRVETESTSWTTGAASYTESQVYGYDQAGQLLTATGPNTRAWTYDDLGRWETSSRPTGEFTYTYDDANQLTIADCTAGPCADTTYTYDRAGRRATATNSAETRTYTYGPDGKLATHTIDDGASVETTSRVYDGTGNLTTITVDDGTTTTNATYTWDITQTVTDLIEYDHGVNPTGIIGLTDAVTTRTGGHTGTMATAATWQRDRTDLLGDPYGLPDTQPYALGQLGYRGELHTGNLIHLRNRDYDPTTGQFLTKDPLDGVNGTTVVATPYHYTNNNPVNLVDPLGLQPGDDVFFVGSHPTAAYLALVAPIHEAAMEHYRKAELVRLLALRPYETGGYATGDCASDTASGLVDTITNPTKIYRAYWESQNSFGTGLFRESVGHFVSINRQVNPFLIAGEGSATAWHADTGQQRCAGLVQFAAGSAAVLGGASVLAPRYADDLVDLSSSSRRNHILDGEVLPGGRYSGGHRAGTGFPRKSEFPGSWSDDQILHHVSDIATDPSLTWRPGRGGDFWVSGTRDGIDIEVLIRNGEIWTAYPTNVPRNPG
jgi:RHS repeat-associated protein